MWGFLKAWSNRRSWRRQVAELERQHGIAELRNRRFDLLADIDQSGEYSLTPAQHRAVWQELQQVKNALAFWGGYVQAIELGYSKEVIAGCLEKFETTRSELHLATHPVS